MIRRLIVFIALLIALSIDCLIARIAISQVVGPCPTMPANISGATLRADFNNYANGTSPTSFQIVGAIAGRCAQWASDGSIVPAGGGCAVTLTVPAAIPTPASGYTPVPNSLIPAFFANVNSWLGGSIGIKPIIVGAVAGHGATFDVNGTLIDTGGYIPVVGTPVSVPTPASGYVNVPGTFITDLPTIRANLNARWCGGQAIRPRFLGAGHPGDCVMFATDGSPGDAGAPCVTTVPTVTPTPSPTATPTPTGGTLAIVGPNGSTSPVHTDSYCASIANQAGYGESVPRNVSDGTGWNYNNVTLPALPSYYTTNSNRCVPAGTYLNNVTGNYSGTTAAIIRWSSCKWGVGELDADAENKIESGWNSSCPKIFGGSTCYNGGDCGNPDTDSGGETSNLTLTVGGRTFTVTNGSSQFVGTKSYGGVNSNGTNCPSSYASFGPIQNKIDTCEWYAYPQAVISTAFAEDYRWAKWRACMNGAYSTRFHSQDNARGTDYDNAVTAASNPNGTSSGAYLSLIPGNAPSPVHNIDYLNWGCIATHCSGGWYGIGGCSFNSYMTSFFTSLTAHNWPGGVP